MRKIFSILVTLMVIGLTFMSCKPTTGDTKNGTGSSTGTDTTVPPISNDPAALKKFMKETFDDFTQSDNGKVYSGKIKGTENDYVLIPAKASIGEFKKIKDNVYSFGDAKLIKNNAEGMNVYFYRDGDDYFKLGSSPYTITMSSTLKNKYFGSGRVNEFIVIGRDTFNIYY